ncbi:MAG TPA: hypothetical protein VIM02_12505 [Rhizomicrobium sp.]|jgi:hypothetical protein
MQYKLYHYTIANDEGRLVGPSKHFDLFNKSTGADVFGKYARYRNQANSILMHIQKYDPDFAGLIGKHSTEREVTKYDQKTDVTQQIKVGDDDYPHAAFICYPRLGILLCVDGSEINATTAISRLHAILAFRQNVQFVAQPLTEVADLRRAVKKFRLVEVDYEVLPVNPHTKDLGMGLDRRRKLDHIKRMSGRLEASPSDPLQLNGGFLSEIQELQESGHGRVGYTGVDDEGTEIKVPKPKEAKPLHEDEDKTTPGTSPEVKITLPGVKMKYPFTVGHVGYMKRIAEIFVPTTDG